MLGDRQYAVGETSKGLGYFFDERNIGRNTQTLLGSADMA